MSVLEKQVVLSINTFYVFFNYSTFESMDVSLLSLSLARFSNALLPVVFVDIVVEKYSIVCK